MGNFLYKDPLVLDFNGLKTENISSTIPYMKKYDTDALTLVSRLNATQNKSMVLFNESENYDMYKLFEKSPNISNNDNNFSETSPFISSDVYKHLVKKQQGGGFDDEEESSTSSSSSSDKKSKKSDKNSDKKHKKDKKKNHKEDSDYESSVFNDEDDEELDEAEMKASENDFESEMSTGSYLSSSAHTDGAEDSNMESDLETTVSVKNHRSLRNMSDSVRTSDINIISVDE